MQTPQPQSSDYEQQGSSPYHGHQTRKRSIHADMIEPMGRVRLGYHQLGSTRREAKEEGELTKKPFSACCHYRSAGRELRLAHQAPLHGPVCWAPLRALLKDQNMVTSSLDLYPIMIQPPLLSIRDLCRQTSLPAHFSFQAIIKMRPHGAPMSKDVASHHNALDGWEVCAQKWMSRHLVQNRNPPTKV